MVFTNLLQPRWTCTIFNLESERVSQYRTCHSLSIHLNCSGSFAGLLFLSYYLAGKLQCFSAPAPKSLLNFCISLCPSLLALFIALSRYCDYWHHYQVSTTLYHTSRSEPNTLVDLISASVLLLFLTFRCINYKLEHRGNRLAKTQELLK